MCYAIPGKLIKISGNTGVVEYYGEQRNVRLDLGSASIGDYVYAQGGIIVRSIPEKEALEVLDAWKELFVELKKIDEERSRLKERELASNTLGLFQKINQNKELSKEEALTLLKLTKKSDLDLFYNLANNIRQKNHGNAACVHGIVEFSNYCSSNCLYCGIRSSSNTPRYRMTEDEIFEACEYAAKKLQFYALLLQSGEDSGFDEDVLCRLMERLKKLQILVILSLGSKPPSLYKKLYEKGARGALLRFETSNESIFDKLRPGFSFESRLGLIKEIKKIGYILATGFIVGLPGETDEDIYNNILLCKSLKPEMYSFGPFIKAEGTPLAGHPQADFSKILKTIALARVMDRDCNILVTTAMETLQKEALIPALDSGANSLMLNITPQKYRQLYKIYDNRSGIDKDPGSSIKNTVKLLQKMGRAPVDIGI